LSPRRTYRQVPRSQVLQTADTVIEAQSFVLNRPTAAHDHDFVELVLVTGGKGRHLAANGHKPLQRGSCMLIRPGAWHAYEHCDKLRLYNCYFGPELLERELAWIGEDPQLGRLLWAGNASLHLTRLQLLKLDEQQTRSCAALLKRLAEKKDPAASRRVARIGILLQALQVIADSLPAKPVGGLDGSGHPLVRRGQRLLEERLNHDWTLAELAGVLGVGRCHIARLFKQHTGNPPMTYLAMLRLNHAASLLLTNDWPIGEIANRVGWPDANYFARRFRQQFGCSASRYRSQFASAGILGVSIPGGDKLP